MNTKKCPVKILGCCVQGHCEHSKFQLMFVWMIPILLPRNGTLFFFFTECWVWRMLFCFQNKPRIQPPLFHSRMRREVELSVQVTGSHPLSTLQSTVTSPPPPSPFPFHFNSDVLYIFNVDAAQCSVYSLLQTLYIYICLRTPSLSVDLKACFSVTNAARGLTCCGVPHTQQPAMAFSLDQVITKNLPSSSENNNLFSIWRASCDSLTISHVVSLPHLVQVHSLRLSQLCACPEEMYLEITEKRTWK